MPPIWLYWLAAQQQTSTPTTQNRRYFYRKFGAKGKELGILF